MMQAATDGLQRCLLPSSPFVRFIFSSHNLCVMGQDQPPKACMQPPKQQRTFHTHTSLGIHLSLSLSLSLSLYIYIYIYTGTHTHVFMCYSIWMKTPAAHTRHHLNRQVLAQQKKQHLFLSPPLMIIQRWLQFICNKYDQEYFTHHHNFMCIISTLCTHLQFACTRLKPKEWQDNV